MAQILPFLRQPHRYQSARPPRWPFSRNYDSPQSQGLTVWFPIIHQVEHDVIYDLARPQKGKRTFGGTMPSVVLESGIRAALPSNNRINADETTGLFDNVDEMTISGWCVPKVETVHQSLCGLRKTSNTSVFYILQLTNKDDWECRFANSSSTFFDARINSVPTGVPTHMCLTKNATFLKSYANGGALTATASPTGQMTASGEFDALDVQFASGSRDFINPAWDMRAYLKHHSDSEVAAFWDIDTRWDLYYELGRVFYSIPVAAPAGGRIMSSLARFGGLAGKGGIAGAGGGLAG